MHFYGSDCKRWLLLFGLLESRFRVKLCVRACLSEILCCIFAQICTLAVCCFCNV